MTGWPVVRLLKRFRSSGRDQRSLFWKPNSRFSPIAAITLILKGLAIFVDMSSVGILEPLPNHYTPPMSQTYEIEIKSLLGTKERADHLRAEVEKRGAKLLHTNKQLNHYFTLQDKETFQKELLPKIPHEKQEIFHKLLTEANSVSVRTREVDGKVILVVKASLGSDTSDNGVSRQEFETEMPMTLQDLDNLLLSAGLTYQAKWSREREEYELGDTHICLDRNAGYGYLAEFEKMSADASQAESIKEEIYLLMNELGAEELKQDRLERMFAYYNTHWQDYYGTDKVFNIE
jgi:adenylate cyclase class IV